MLESVQFHLDIVPSSVSSCAATTGGLLTEGAVCCCCWADCCSLPVTTISLLVSADLFNGVCISRDEGGLSIMTGAVADG